MAASFCGRWAERLFTRRITSHSGPVALDPLLFYVSPLQLWLNRLVHMVSTTGTMDDSWLPVFTIASSHLRLVFARIHSENQPKTKFSFQWEVDGMLLLGVVLEASAILTASTVKPSCLLTGYRS